MKVTVNFGSVRVIVPCGKGDLPVKKLMDLAITRYKKATGKSVDSWVTIHNLKLLSDGGILDPDDKLNDVADDREQITAVYDEEISSYLMHNGGDGTSASSIGTESPDIFQNGDLISLPISKSYDGSDVEIKDEKLASGLLPLHVRRGSEPALNRLSPSLLPNTDSCKRWSAAVLGSDDAFKRLNSEGEEVSEDDIPPGEREDGSGEEKSVSYQQYLDSWNHETRLNQDQRKEPLGGPITSPNHTSDEAEDSECSNSSSNNRIEVLKLRNEDGPLGIRIVPAEDSTSKNNGVVIEGIEPGGRIDRDGRFAVGDRITEINGLKLSKDSYKNAHEILKDALKAPELNIHCIKKKPLKRRKGHKLSTLPQPIASLQKIETRSEKSEDETDKVKSAIIPSSLLSTPTKKLLANVLHKGTPTHSSIRKIGRRILVHLTKGSVGLGFSITSKDPNNGPPFFIKNILAAGAAVDDGRLKTGDKLLEVNKMDVSNLTQSEVLAILRKVPFGEMVELVISRQETDLSPSPMLPRQLPPDKAGEEVGVVPWKRRDVFTYEVPLNDTGSAGLGVSVKGKTSNTPKGPLDMGIFLKNIFHGGAAHKDGRLCTNDQLLSVNGISLLGMTNGEAMETLRRAMIQSEGPSVVSNAIILKVARRVTSLTENPSDQGESSGHDRSDSLLSESGDSFYVSTENLSLFNKCNGITPDTSTSDNSATTVILMTPGKKQPSTIHEELDSNSKSSMDDTQNNVPVAELINIGESADFNNVNTNQYAQYTVQTQPEVHHQRHVSDLIEFHQRSASLSNSEPVNGGGSLVNHHKTFSNLTEMDLYQSVDSDNDKIHELSHCDSPTFHKESTKRKRVPAESKSHFRRNGMGRQSMPEKKLLQNYYQRTQGSHNENSPDTRVKHCTPQPNESFRTPQYCRHSAIREMPVDVGPYETYMRTQVKTPHQSRGSCDSPDCPYHAVPTTLHDSGSSDGLTQQVGPSLGLFKSSSLESLQTMLHEQQKQGASLTNGSSSRGCNESFRAAVDKSFEATDKNENSVVNGDGPQHCSNVRNHTRSKTVETMEKKDAKPHKKKGLFKGLGSVFRFGKSNKKGNKELSENTKPESSDTVSRQEEQNRIQMLHQEQIDQRLQTQPSNEQATTSPANRALKQSFTFPRNRIVPSTLSPQGRQERMYALRVEHQKKHKMRNGYYPQENQEELYEQRLREIVDSAMVNRPLPPLPHQQNSMQNPNQINNPDMSPKSKSFEIYQEMSKPGSRRGIVDPNRYSHYMNFQEIQQHLQQFRHHQSLFFNDNPNDVQTQYAQFLSDPKYTSPNKRYFRHTVSSSRSRPVSELFDLRNGDLTNSSFRGISESGSLPRKMFHSTRQRPPIPMAFMEQMENRTLNGRSPSFYQTSNSGSKV